MRNGPILVVFGSIAGSLILAILLFNLTVKATIGASMIQTHYLPAVIGTSQAENIPQAVSEVTGCEISESYPASIRQWCDLITKYSEARGLDPDLIAALIWQESGGNPTAYSSSGAVGLMQVMPKDGVAASFMCANGPCFQNRPTIAELQNPDFNISYGVQMLSDLNSRRGNLREALRSYGPMDVGYYYADKVLNIYQNNAD